MSGMADSSVFTLEILHLWNTMQSFSNVLWGTDLQCEQQPLLQHFGYKNHQEKWFVECRELTSGDLVCQEQICVRLHKTADQSAHGCPDGLHQPHIVCSNIAEAQPMLWRKKACTKRDSLTLLLMANTT